MRIKINTGNGCMDVELAAFFPNNITKTRKLFRLIRAGCGLQDRELIRGLAGYARNVCRSCPG